MPDRTPRRRSPRVHLSMATVAIAGLWVLVGTDLRASSVSAPSKHGEAHPGHRCKCGMNCGSTCCCAGEEAKPPARDASKPPASRPSAASRPGPCVSAAPCGGALPSQLRPLIGLGEPADRLGGLSTPPPTRGSRMVPPASERAEGVAGSRMDEPPERLDD